MGRKNFQDRLLWQQSWTIRRSPPLPVQSVQCLQKYLICSQLLISIVIKPFKLSNIKSVLVLCLFAHNAKGLYRLRANFDGECKQTKDHKWIGLSKGNTNPKIPGKWKGWNPKYWQRLQSYGSFVCLCCPSSWFRFVYWSCSCKSTLRNTLKIPESLDLSDFSPSLLLILSTL